MAWLISLNLAFFANVAQAQRVYWDPAGGSLAFGQESRLQLTFENCEPKGGPQPPKVDGLELQYLGSGTNMSWVNGVTTRSVMLTYSARPTQRATVRIPAFEAETDKGRQRVAAVSFEVGNATVGQSGIPLESVAGSRLTPSEGAYWAGEIFPVTYTLDISQRFRTRQVGRPQWAAGPLSMEEWGEPEQITTMAGGEPRAGLVYKTRGSITTPGSYTLKPVEQQIVLLVPSSRNLLFPGFGLDSEPVEHTVVSNAPALTIKPLPDGAPADFSGAVGEFKFASKVVPATVTVGVPVTWTLELSGTGNWPAIRGLPAREVSKDFRVLQPQAKRTPADGKLFDATLTEDVVLIPTRTGNYTFGPVSFSYFDPHSGVYKTVQSERTMVTVTPAAAPATQPRAATPPVITLPGENPPPAAHHLEPAVPPAPPAAIPRDPLPGAAMGPVPMSERGLWLWMLSSLFWLLPVWLLLAALRARRTDPLRNRREARARLRQTLAYLRGAAAPEARAQALHAWQRDTAVLLGIDHAAPSPAMLDRFRPLAFDLRPSDQSDWKVLWSESDHALYGPDAKLPDNWLVRAEAALETARLPGWSSLSLFLPHNLFPWMAGAEIGSQRSEVGRLAATAATTTVVLLALLSAICFPQSAIAADETQNSKPKTQNPAIAYGMGDFAGAARIWRNTIDRTPADWMARHNLGLALAQQGHWPEAAAYWTSAFVLNPRPEPVRWHLAFGFEHAGYTPAGFGEFAQASGPHLLARAASPAEWQRLLIAAGALFALGALVLLLRAYGAKRRWQKPAAVTVMGLGFLLALMAVTSLHFYGDSADARAAIVWHQALLRSIPTEADTQQKTSGLPAGSLAVMDKTFLGWARLVFSNGQTGWVRKNDVVMLYR